MKNWIILQFSVCTNRLWWESSPALPWMQFSHFLRTLCCVAPSGRHRFVSFIEFLRWRSECRCSSTIFSTWSCRRPAPGLCADCQLCLKGRAPVSSCCSCSAGTGASAACTYVMALLCRRRWIWLPLVAKYPVLSLGFSSVKSVVLCLITATRGCSRFCRGFLWSEGAFVYLFHFVTSFKFLACLSLSFFRLAQKSSPP